MRHRSALGGYLIWPALAVLGLALVMGGWPAQSASGAAQSLDPEPLAARPATVATDPAFFAATGYRIANPAFLDFFRKRGGLRTFGYPVSNEFELLGTRVQLFQRQVLQVQPDGSVGSLNLLDQGLLPVTRLNGSTFPAPDPALAAAVPPPDAPGYHERALAFLAEAAPDEWAGRPVNFGAAVRSTVTCADAFPEGSCEEGLLPALALQIWGLPTSRPAADPANERFVYQRYQRGILHYDQGCECTQGLLLGDWFKRVLLGGLPGDLAEQVAGSRFYAQYAPGAPAGLARPAELPGSSLAGAFEPAESALVPPPTPAPTSLPTSTPVPLPGNSPPTPASTPTATTPTTPVVGSPDLCLGDEQMVFVPPKPHVGTDVVVAVTSARHHDKANVRLTGPVKPGEVRERLGLNGWVWEWTISPTIEGSYEFAFYVDGARRCATAGFNTLPPFGATATPTPTPAPTNTPLPSTPTVTPTPTSTPKPTATPTPPKPAIQRFNPVGGAGQGATCGGPLAIFGLNFGDPPLGNFNGSVTFPGSESQYGATLFFGSIPVPTSSILVWNSAEIDFFVPTSGLRNGQTYDVLVRIGNQVSETKTYQLRTTGNCPA